MRISAMLVAGLALALGAVVPSTAEATSLRKLNLEERVELSDRVVRGTVVEIWTERDSNGVVWTRAQLDITDVYKGTAVDTLVIDQLGGNWAGLITTVGGASRFSVGEDMVVCLQQLESDHLVPVGMAQGKWTVRLDPYSQQEIVQRFAPPMHEVYDHRFIPLPKADKREHLADFEDRIRTRVALDTTSIVEEK